MHISYGLRFLQYKYRYHETIALFICTNLIRYEVRELFSAKLSEIYPHAKLIRILGRGSIYRVAMLL